MRRIVSKIIIACVLMASAGLVHAEFRVSDLVYVPVVAHSVGANDSVWRSDVKITNMEAEDNIDVALVLLPSGLHSNASTLYDRTFTAGGREADGFGILDEELADIPPGASIVLEDVIEKYWPAQTGLNGQGALVVFSYLSGSLQPDGSRDYRNMLVSSRTYNVATIYTPDPDNEGGFLESTGTYGQTIPGVPFYDLADGGFKDDTRDFSFVWLDGARENDAFRYNLGVVNTSDPQTTLVLKIQPFDADGQPFFGDSELPLAATIQVPPLAHLQYFQILSSMFGFSDLDQATLKISILSWTSTGVDPHPTFTTYGSLVDNVTNDATTFTPTFAQPYDIDCMWSIAGAGKQRVTAPRRVLKIPPKF